MKKEEVFRFSPGLLQRSEYYAFLKVMDRILGRNRNLVVILDKYDDFDIDLLSDNAIFEFDHDSIHQGILFFPERNFRRAFHHILDQASPVFMFGYSEDFTSLLGRLRYYFKEPNIPTYSFFADFSPVLVNDFLIISLVSVNSESPSVPM